MGPLLALGSVALGVFMFVKLNQSFTERLTLASVFVGGGLFFASLFMGINQWIEFDGAQIKVKRFYTRRTHAWRVEEVKEIWPLNLNFSDPPTGEIVIPEVNAFAIRFVSGKKLAIVCNDLTNTRELIAAIVAARFAGRKEIPQIALPPTAEFVGPFFQNPMTQLIGMFFSTMVPGIGVAAWLGVQETFGIVGGLLLSLVAILVLRHRFGMYLKLLAILHAVGALVFAKIQIDELARSQTPRSVGNVVLCVIGLWVFAFLIYLCGDGVEKRLRAGESKKA